MFILNDKQIETFACISLNFNKKLCQKIVRFEFNIDLIDLFVWWSHHCVYL